jgi:hypothetical protein
MTKTTAKRRKTTKRTSTAMSRTNRTKTNRIKTNRKTKATNMTKIETKTSRTTNKR